MTTKHDGLEWFAGDDWQINATLVDENEVPYDLGSATVLWALLNSSGQRVLDEDDVQITVTDAPAGKCSIRITALKTSPLTGGNYTDYIRIIISGIVSTLSTGTIQVFADPWIAEEPAAAAMAAKPPFRFKRIVAA